MKVDVEIPEVPDDWYACIILCTDGNGRFGFYVKDQVGETLAELPPTKRNENIDQLLALLRSSLVQCTRRFTASDN